ncbi:MAG: hypothetical protein IT393_07295 [Nitrospirae bacterium]|nr:hypothetical protein [Nitrospirota bacterium]
MADSKRQQIVNAIDGKLKTILVSNGYETSLGNNVYEYWDVALEESELPGVIWRDSSEICTPLISDMQDRLLTVSLTLQAIGADAPKQLRKMIADIEKAIKTDLTWGGLAIDTDPVNMTEAFEIEHKEHLVGACRIEFTLKYRTGYLNPYQ